MARASTSHPRAPNANPRNRIRRNQTLLPPWAARAVMAAATAAAVAGAGAKKLTPVRAAAAARRQLGGWRPRRRPSLTHHTPSTRRIEGSLT
eukprot:CAMPEP_0198692354 /NCGR_PEP_ID=MMETSP1468-20131203/224603_1 /TAXON_ID=1461545 /ORGANISM="Mantoniella sp, Strain CCMP1436" /LENGTH=91 /DNA_ID=CAMNT_0044446199 /DNA_START=13 /DNA_END=284 /DNA_ORIENTATION=+